MNQSPSVKAVRTLGQGSATWAVYTLISSFGHIQLTQDQFVSIIILGTPVMTFIWNRIEAHSERKNPETKN